MIIYADASYDKFAVSTVLLEDENSKSCFIPEKFIFNGRELIVNQIIAEFYAVYMAIIFASSCEKTTIYTDNKGVYEYFNNISRSKNKQINFICNTIMPLFYSKDIDIVHINRKYNNKANDIALGNLRCIRNMLNGG